jgi:hypothetical protein
MVDKMSKKQANNHLDDKATALYVDAISRNQQSELPEDYLVHVQECTLCKDKILDLSIFLRNPDRPSASLFSEFSQSQREKRPWLNYRRVAAIFIVSALIIGAYLLVFKDAAIIKNRALLPLKDNMNQETIQRKGEVVEAGTNQQKHTVDISKTKTKKNLKKVFAENYRVNPNLENMIGSKYRSADVEILSPHNNAYIKGEILFSWKRISHSPLTLKIINNKNEEFFDHLIKENKYLLKRRLSPGLYYWKLENKNDLLYIGKFFVN